MYQMNKMSDKINFVHKRNILYCFANINSGPYAIDLARILYRPTCTVYCTMLPYMYSRFANYPQHCVGNICIACALPHRTLTSVSWNFNVYSNWQLCVRRVSSIRLTSGGAGFYRVLLLSQGVNICPRWSLSDLQISDFGKKIYT